MTKKRIPANFSELRLNNETGGGCVKSNLKIFKSNVGGERGFNGGGGDQVNNNARFLFR